VFFPEIAMRLHFAVLVAALFSCAGAASWKNDSLRIRIQLPGTWAFVTPAVADQRIRSAKEEEDALFYAELKKRTEAGSLFLFEKSPKSKVRADLQSTPLGRPLGGVLLERDIRNLCPLWAANPGENEMPFLDCQPRKLGIAWTALLTYEPAPGRFEYQVKYFRPDGKLILLTVAGTKADAEAMLKNTRFY
jgi:hypothetical protein